MLVVAGGGADRDAFLAAGFENVTISNIDDSGADDAYAPYAWSYADAEALPFDDGSFDWAVVSAGLHHCASPHRALLELYRVARRGLLAIESRDSLLMRLALRLGAAEPLRVDGRRRARLRRGRRPQHRRPEPRLPLDRARGREDDRVERAGTRATGSAGSASSSCQRRCIEMRRKPLWSIGRPDCGADRRRR